MILSVGFATAVVANPPVEFDRDIRPILRENCFACHGPDSSSRKAGLRLDTKEGLFGAAQQGSALIVKGRSKDSLLYQRLTARNPDDLMPPPKSHKALEPREIALIGDWISQGAPWQKHWAFETPKRPPLPRVKNPLWLRNPIDAFVLASLESHGLKPAPEADQRGLIRRLTLDLTGLPPTPEEVAAFVGDTSPSTYERAVDRLLSSLRYGEHRARYWLDAARYGDTHGLHHDNYREIWPFRDWVINAFNRNQPFDQFTIEQVAGDLLPNPTPQQLTATGFHRCCVSTHEGGTIEAENLANYARDRVETTASVWLGLTMNCAACHDHKFDPISMRDFYSLSAYFRNTTQNHMDGNVKDPEPALRLALDGADAERWGRLSRELDVAKAALAEKTKQLKALAATATTADLERRLGLNSPIATYAHQETKFSATASAPNPAPAPIPPPPAPRGTPTLHRASVQRVNPVTLTQTRSFPLPSQAGSVPVVPARPATNSSPVSAPARNASVDLGNLADFEKSDAFSVNFLASNAGGYRRFGPAVGRMEQADNERPHRGWRVSVVGGDVFVHLVHQWPNNAIEVATTSQPLKVNLWRLVTVTYDGSGRAEGVRIRIDGKSTGWRANKNSLNASIRVSAPLQVLHREGFGDTGGVRHLQVFARELQAVEVRLLPGLPALAAIAEKPAAARTPRDQAQLFDFYSRADGEFQKFANSVTSLQNELGGLRQSSPTTLVQKERTDAQPMAHILKRGEYDQPGEQVGPGVPGALHPLPLDAPDNRLGLARWLVAPDNPLTARVIVNRFWQEIFGSGIVRTAGDFGVVGEPPSHPALLDWLAVEFQESGWDVKHIFRLMVTSAAYRQTAAVPQEDWAKDPDNRLLARGPRFRMDAEMIRDHALAASGLLGANIGGPSVKPYQPDGIWETVAIIQSNTRRYTRDTGDKLYRRSLYTFWKRTAPPASMEVFNAPTREICTVRRERTNTPMQALASLNDVQFIEAARHLAQGALLRGGGSFDGRLAWMSERLLARTFSPAETTVANKTLRGMQDYYRIHPSDAQALLQVGESRFDASLDRTELAAWTMLANTLMNLDEVLNK
ncbi:MAG: PSD1 and planctomycete cytochrome C domain-containing protein [Verrucomicrobiota bacterium]